MEGRDMFSKDHKPREYVISARDRCDYTIERVRAVTTKRYKYLRNFLTDRPFMQPQYRDGRDYIEVPRKLYKEGKLNAVQSFIWNPKRPAEELYDLKKRSPRDRKSGDRLKACRSTQATPKDFGPTGSKKLTTKDSTLSRLTRYKACSNAGTAKR